MPREARRIPYEELASNLAGVFERIVREQESVLVEREGKMIAVVTPVAPKPSRRRRPVPLSDDHPLPQSPFTLESAAGSVPPLVPPLDWKEVEHRVKEERVERDIRKMRDQ